jgi:beta-phosphoglucomutase
MDKSSSLPAGVIFDMDGVLLESEEFICRAATKMFAEHGLAVKPRDFDPFVGTGEDRYIGGVAETYGLKLNLPEAKKRTYEIYFELIRGKLKPLAGVREFINTCRKLGKKIAVASSADLKKVQANLREINLPWDTFDAVITAEDVVHKKPAPDIFLLAARRLDIEAHKCLVVEDAINGVAAAKAAGCRCLALTTTFKPEQLAAADWVAPDLAHVPPEVLAWS